MCDERVTIELKTSNFDVTIEDLLVPSKFPITSKTKARYKMSASRGSASSFVNQQVKVVFRKAVVGD